MQTTHQIKYRNNIIRFAVKGLLKVSTDLLVWLNLLQVPKLLYIYMFGLKLLQEDLKSCHSIYTI